MHFEMDRLLRPERLDMDPNFNTATQEWTYLFKKQNVSELTLSIAW